MEPVYSWYLWRHDPRACLVGDASLQNQHHVDDTFAGISRGLI